MSSAATAWAWAAIAAGKCKTASSSLVLLRLADRADPEGVCWPGHDRTSRDLALGGRTVRQALVELQAAGLVIARARFDAAGRQRSNIYQLQIGVADSATPLAKSAEGGGEIRHLQGVAESATLESKEESKKDQQLVGNRLISVDNCREKLRKFSLQMKKKHCE